MTNHDTAVIIEHLMQTFRHIKTLSGSGEIDRMCIDGIAKLFKLSEAKEVQEELDAIRARRLDPMA